MFVSIQTHQSTFVYLYIFFIIISVNINIEFRCVSDLHVVQQRKKQTNSITCCVPLCQLNSLSLSCSLTLCLCCLLCSPSVSQTKSTANTVPWNYRALSYHSFNLLYCIHLSHAPNIILQNACYVHTVLSYTANDNFGLVEAFVGSALSIMSCIYYRSNIWNWHQMETNALQCARGACNHYILLLNVKSQWILIRIIGLALAKTGN